MDTVSRPRILLVEDDGNIAQIIRIGFHDLGIQYELDHALTAEEGIVMWHQRHYDLLLADYNLRGRNGLDLIAQIKGERSTIPTVLVTAYESSKLRKEARQIGVTEFVSKPFFLDEFTALVRGLLPTTASELGA